MAETENQGPSQQALSASPDEVAELGKFLQQTADTLGAAAQLVDTDIDQVMSVWRGSAATVYRGEWDAVRASIAEILNALISMAASLKLVSVGYRHTDAEGAERTGLLNL